MSVEVPVCRLHIIRFHSGLGPRKRFGRQPITEGHEAVVGSGTDEFGIADAVYVKKGSQSIKTPIISDIPLKAGDRLTDFVEIDYDPATGETMYVCWLEY